MFTGIIETLGKLESIHREGTNIHFCFSSPFTSELKVDQSIAHNGICLTVTSIDGGKYTVTAIDETLKKTNLEFSKVGDLVNLERCMITGARLDGHIVQGHVDQRGVCESIQSQDGSWVMRFKYEPNPQNLTVPKGSICINGVSLTVVESEGPFFSVAIIPYTFEHTAFKNLKVGDHVNLEFDIVGKYVARLMDFKNDLQNLK